jgi:hypothetical protein
MWIVLFAFTTIISLPALPFLLGKSNNLTCVRIEINHAEFRQTRTHLFGLFKQQSVSMVVTDTAIKTYEIAGENSTSTGYKIFLSTPTSNLSQKLEHHLFISRFPEFKRF